MRIVISPRYFSNSVTGKKNLDRGHSVRRQNSHMRFAILYFAAVACLLAQSQKASPVCDAGGAVFGVDLVADGLLFKDPVGYIRDVDPQFPMPVVES